MKHKILYSLFVMLALNLALKGQVPDSLKLSPTDSVQLQLLKKIPNEVLMLEVLKIQGQIIDNLQMMMDIMYADQKRMEAKIDSLLIIIQKENTNNNLTKQKKKKKRR
ncbi:hypothetical protein [Gaoshiqia sp. Z1-71]|uniref:hypothetical protein n=1 Tax=Gaoshiqia hydrogeniformans TaxID=3290090 RepID=UPI003BF8E900